jgi:hypothetical protein
MLTGKTISELTLLNIITEETSIPVQLDGITYHIQYSAITDNVRQQGYKTLASGEYSHSEGTSFIKEEEFISTTTINYIDYNVDGTSHNGISSIISISDTEIVVSGDLSTYPTGEIVSLFIQNLFTSFDVNLDYYINPVIDTIEYNSDDDITTFTLSTPFETIYNNVIGKTNSQLSSGKYSHSEGFYNITPGESSHSEGGYNRSGCYGLYSNSIVDGVITINSDSSNFIKLTESFGNGKKYILFDDKQYSDNFGHGVLEYSSYVFDSGIITIYLTDTTFSSIGGLIGTTTETSYFLDIYFQHSEGRNTFAFGSNSHSEGYGTISLGDNSHSEGVFTSSNGVGSHSEGDHTHANGNYSHSEGFESISNGLGSHAEGSRTKSNGVYSHSEGYGTIAEGDYQHASGKYNTTGDTTSLLIVGNGDINERRDSFKVYPISDSLSTILIPQAVDLDCPNDTIAYLRGVPFGGVYHTDGTIKLRRDVVEKPHTFLIQSDFSGNSNWNYSILDYSNKTIKGPIDTNNETSTNTELIPLTNSGYLLIFYNTSTTILTSIFLNLLGDVMETYSSITEDYNSVSLTGNYVVIHDRDNKIFKYSDGLLNVKTIEYTDSFILNSSSDYTNLNGFVCTSGATSGDRSCLFINMDTVITLTNYDSSIYQLDSFLYVKGDFILLTYLNISTQIYDMFEIYSSQGDLLQQENFSALNLNSIEFKGYGTNKTTLIFKNSSNRTIDYLIYNYDGETDILIYTNHQRGDNYSSSFNFNIKDLGPTQTKSENSFIVFYSGYNNNSLVEVNYADILPIFSGDTDFRQPYQFQTSGNLDKSLGINIAHLNDYSFIIPCVSGDGYLSLFVVKPDGYSFTNVFPTNDIENSQISSNQLGNYFGILPYINTYTQGNYYIYDKNGDYVTSESMSNASVSLVIEFDLDTVFVKYDLNSYYYNSISSEFNLIPSGQNYNQVYKSTSFTTESGLNVGNLFIFNSTDKIGRLITPTGITEEVIFYNSNNYEFRINSNYVIHEYDDGSNINITMYDLSLNPIKTVTTNEHSLIDFSLYDDRLLLITSSAGETYNYLITTDTTTVVVLGLTNSQIANDYITWY